MIRFAHAFRRLLTARSARLGRKRLAGVFIAWWIVFCGASVPSPCCDILAAALPRHSVHSMTADHDAHDAAGNDAQYPKCATIGNIDMTVLNAAPLLVAKLQLPDALWLPAAAMAPAAIRQSETFHGGYPQPPPLPRFYLRTSRLLI
jgi:hypothetical protein